jgi:hypothetical protein
MALGKLQRKLEVTHGLSCYNKKIIKNNLVATRSGKFTIFIKVT